MVWATFKTCYIEPSGCESWGWGEGGSVSWRNLDTPYRPDMTQSYLHWLTLISRRIPFWHSLIPTHFELCPVLMCRSHRPKLRHPTNHSLDKVGSSIANPVTEWQGIIRVTHNTILQSKYRCLYPPFVTVSLNLVPGMNDEIITLYSSLFYAWILRTLVHTYDSNHH